VARDRGQLEFLYKVVGSGTRALATLTPGDWLDLVGPLGRGFRLDEGLRHLIMVARGVGLSTLAPLAEWAAAHGVGVTAILSARTPALLMSVDYLAGTGAEVLTVTDEDGSSDPERVAELVRRTAAARGTGLLVTCGSNRLLKLLQRLGQELGIPGQVALEQHMACGIGSCFSCVRTFRMAATGELEYRKVCQAGPVFDLQEAVSW
jgi:dihydroorotate dehydrogenase electron transfer subunit